MNWKDPRVELPENGRIVWVIIQHPKQNKPMSFEMYCGLASYSNDGMSCVADTFDMTGKGNWMVYIKPPEDDSLHSFDDVALAWIYVEEMPLPAWIPHDPHWGAEGK